MDAENVEKVQKKSKEPKDQADPLQVFDFTEAEEAVINSLLEQGPQSVSKLGRTTDLPRTTVYSVLQRLMERGLTKRKSQNYLSVWGLVSPTKLKKGLSKGITYLDRELTVKQLESELGVKVTETTEFFVFRGVEAMLQVYQWMMINHFNQRVCSIQNKASMESFAKKLHHKKMAQLSDLIKDNKVAVDAIMSEGIQDFYKTFLKDKSQLASSMAKSSTAAHLVPESVISSNVDLLVGKQAGFLANWDDEVLVLVKNAEMLALFRCLFEILQKHSVSFDHKEFVQSIIAAKS